MKLDVRASLWSGAVLIGALAILSGCNDTATVGEADAGPLGSRHRAVSSRSIESGTVVQVALGNTISSESAKVGDVWHGTVTNEVRNRNESVIAPGSDVEGVVTGVEPAEGGSRAMLDLAVERIQVNGRFEAIAASTEPVIAGSPRARNLGAIAGGAAAGAVIGSVVGSGKHAALGGLLGGAAATGVVAKSRGYQVVLTDGTVITFTVDQSVAVR